MSYQKTISDLSYKVIIPNWFTREQLEDVVSDKISRKVYQEFLFYVQDSNYMDEVSERIREIWYEFQEEKEEGDD